MPLSKERNRERVKLYMRNKRAMLQPKSEMLQPKLPWYVGAGDHFGEVINRTYAKSFFESLFT